MSYLKYLCVLVLIFNVHLLPGARGQGELDSFVRLAMANYSAWLQARNWDPTISLEESKDISDKNALVDIDCEISNEYVVGHSTKIGVGISQTDLLYGQLYALFSSSENVTFKGTYKANGTVLGVPLSGSGNWFISTDRVSHTLEYDGFTVTPEGYIDLSTANFSCKLGIGSGVTSYFEGLLDEGAGGYENAVKRTLQNKYFSLMNGSPEKSPLIQMVKIYLQGIFEETSLSQIIGANMSSK